MAEQQKIHPVSDRDVETAHPPPTAPLVPPGTSKSDTADAAAGEGYPPFQRTFPVTHSKPPKKRSCLCRCFCWTAGLVLFLIVIIGIVAGILFLVFRPKFPDYSIDRMQVTQFILNPDSSLYATFNVTISARNPNKKIGIYYEGGSYINVWYTNTKLCEGSLPKFYQGHRNTTVLNVPMTGQTQDANGLFLALQQQQQQTGSIPMDLKVKQPVRIKLGKLKLMKVKFLVRCRLNVDNLNSNNIVTTRNSSCKIRFRL